MLDVSDKISRHSISKIVLGLIKVDDTSVSDELLQIIKKYQDIKVSKQEMISYLEKNIRYAQK